MINIGDHRADYAADDRVKRKNREPSHRVDKAVDEEGSNAGGSRKKNPNEHEIREKV